MERKLKRQKGEVLHVWITRVSKRLGDKYILSQKEQEELEEVISDISKASFIEGSNLTHKLDKKYGI